MKIRKALADSEHAFLLPASVEHMEDENLVWQMGSTTVKNYLDDMRRAQQETFRPASWRVLARVRRIDLLFQRINAAFLELSSTDAWQTNAVDSKKLSELIKKHFQIEGIRKNITNPATQKRIIAARGACDNLQEMFSKESDEKNSTPVKCVITIRKSFMELYQHARYFAKHAKDKLPRDLLAMEAAYIAARPEESASDDTVIAYHLNYAKYMANTGYFGKEDILYQIVGGRNFILKLRADLAAQVKCKRRSSENPLLARKEIMAIYEASKTGEQFVDALNQAGYILTVDSNDSYVLVNEAGDVHGLKRRIEGATLEDLKQKFTDLGAIQLPPLKDVRKERRAAWKEKYGNDYDYMDFYFKFGAKHIKGFIENTLGMAMFAHENDKPLMNWSVDDVKQLKAFISSRYQLLHDVVEGLANKKTNPLGSNLSRAQLVTLMLEVFRSAIYPNYRNNLRVGIGASEDVDIPIRMTGYVMNALDILTTYRRVNAARGDGPGLNLPNLTIVSGATLGARVNGFDQTAMEERGLRIFKLIDEFIGEFYPELRDSVKFEQPSQQDIFDNGLYQKLFAAVKEVTTPKIRTNNKWSARVEREQKLQNIIGTLADFALKRINADIDHVDEATKQRLFEMARCRAIEYATAHKMPLVFGAIQEPGKSLTATWKIGCSSERHFDAFCESTAALIGTKPGFYYPNANFMSGLYGGLTTTTSMGRDLPPYYKSDKKFDPGLDEVKHILSNGDAGGKQIVDRIKKDVDGPAADLNLMLSHPRFQGREGQCAWSSYVSFLSRCNL